MNLDIFKIPDSSGKMSKEYYVYKNYIDEYNYIINYCNNNNIFNIPFKEKLYLCFNRLKSVPKCKNPNCNKGVSFKNSTIGYLTYCSNRCISSDPYIKKIKESKSLEKWGTKTPSESKEIKDKILETNNERYGGNSPMNDDLIKKKSSNTLLKNHGVLNPSNSKELLEKRVESFKKSDWLKNYKSTCMDKWGVESTLSIKEIHEKTVNSSIITKNLNLVDSIKSKIDNNQYEYVDIDFKKYKRDIIILCKKCNQNFNINREDLHLRYRNNIKICTNCNPINTQSSGSEIELKDYISNLYNGEILYNSRKIIQPLELDIYLPELKIGIEFNGLWWHSESKKGKYYHINKFNKCNDLDIRLINVWEDDWVYKNEIIKSIIKNSLSICSDKIYARKCNIEEISSKESKLFLINNHIIGESKSSIKISLKYNNEIVSLMCFINKGNGCWELSRFCNIINKNIIGGASKLLKYFINRYNPNEIISFSDNSIYNGGLYEKLGFLYNNDCDINYKWVVNKKREHKSNFRKSKLNKMGFNCNNKSESEIMLEIGSYKIWDCGLKKWIWRKT